MQVAGIASNYTIVPAGSTAALIAGGSTIIVYGMLFAASGNSILSVLEADGTTTIASVRLIANSTAECRTHFIASKGLAITTTASSTCVVFHSTPGA